MNKYQPKEIKDKILEYIKKNNIYISDFCEICNISRVTYYYLISGKNKYIKEKVIKGLKKCGIL